MYRCEINKRELSEYMSMSYPTMLSKLKKPDSETEKDNKKPLSNMFRLGNNKAIIKKKFKNIGAKEVTKNLP